MKRKMIRSPIPAAAVAAVAEKNNTGVIK